MSQTIIRLPAVIKQTGKSRSSIYRDVDLGFITPPINIGARSIGWPSYEIDEVISARIAGKTDREIKTLVKNLLTQRVQKREGSGGQYDRD